MADNPIISRMKADMAVENFFVGSPHEVVATHVNDVNSFFVRLAYMTEHVRLLEERGEPMNVEDIDVGKRVIYKSKVLNKHVRGKIQFISIRDLGTLIRFHIFALDYGCVDRDIPVNYIFSPTMDIDCPPLALHCKLHFWYPKEYTQEALDSLKCALEKRIAEIVIMYKQEDKLVVELNSARLCVYPIDLTGVDLGPCAPKQQN